MQVQDHVTLSLRQINIKPEILGFRIEVHSPLPPVAMVTRSVNLRQDKGVGRSSRGEIASGIRCTDSLIADKENERKQGETEDEREYPREHSMTTTWQF